ncbi:prenyltransferase/squalene oxidase repeat-containing protein [Woodsholea maritima]|uniref:hypothetical protein n=1 Tax=Woodsholea maritima TaxID=240237 RepID=UPI00035F6F59|nr:hypothetical protein [Woodsholea maritima]
MSRERPASAHFDLEACADWIETLQGKDGSIPWIERGIWDAWNHGESVMALAIAGRKDAAHRGLEALAARQNEDGSWSCELGAGVPMDAANERLAPPQNLPTVRDTNFAGYVAVVVLRTALALDAPRVLTQYRSMVERALDFVLAQQSPHGDIVWKALDAGEDFSKVDSVRAGNCSLYKSLECGLRLMDALGEDRADWREARLRLGDALTRKPHRFDRFATQRARYAMDWYYPILSGVLLGKGAKAHLDQHWDTYVVADLGCRCVSDQPWVTAAETAELALACLSLGERETARTLIQDLAPMIAPDGGYWMGWQFEMGVIWPRERPSWTAAALILAMDALDELSPGHDLLIRHAGPCAEFTPGAEIRAY